MRWLISVALAMLAIAEAHAQTTISSVSPDIIVTPKSGGYNIGAGIALLDQSKTGGAIATGASEYIVKLGNFSYTLAPAGSSGFPAKWSTTLLNLATGSGAATITTTGSFFEGASGSNILSLPPGGRATLIVDGANWLTLVGAQPLPVLSADGTKSSAPSGPALLNAAGSWSWGSAASGRPGEYNVVQNGLNNGVGMLMEVADGGQLFIDTASQGWWVWNPASGAYSKSSGP